MSLTDSAGGTLGALTAYLLMGGTVVAAAYLLLGKDRRKTNWLSIAIAILLGTAGIVGFFVYRGDVQLKPQPPSAHGY